MRFFDELYYSTNGNRNRIPLPYEKTGKTFSDIENKLSKELNGENLKLFDNSIFP